MIKEPHGLHTARPLRSQMRPDGTTVTPRPRVRQPPPIRPVRRRPPLRLPLASAHRRMHTLLIIVAMALSLCAGRLLQLQGFDSSSYSVDALTRTLPLLPARGQITDRNGLVADFFERMQFAPLAAGEGDGAKRYVLDVAAF